MKIPLRICVVFLVVALVAAPMVSAKETTGYTMRPSTGNASEVTIMVTDSIMQGETNTHQFYVGNGVNWLEVYHDWKDSSDSLTLTIYTPGWDEIGTFHDIDDGVTDGKIHIDIRT